MKALFEKHKSRFATGAIILLALLNFVSYQTGIGVGEPDARARPTGIVPTLTPKPGRGTPTATPTKLATLTPSTPLPSPTALKTVTPGLPTATPVAGNPCSNWHPYGPDLRYPSLGAFDMGVNPCTLIPVFGETLENYLVSQNVDGLPVSSALEERDGYTWLYIRVAANGTQDMQAKAGEGCALFDNGANPIPDKTCITNVAQRVHTRGDMAHAKKRNHSVVIVARACAIANGKPVAPCGVVLTTGIEDWGVKHQPYKSALCIDDTTPRNYQTNALYPLSLIGQPPYVALQPPRNGFAHQLISTITFNKIVEDYYHTAWYPEFPNHIIRVTWGLLDATEQFTCNDDEPIPTGYLAVRYIMHAVTLANLPTERPFVGFTNQNGYLDPACLEISPVCFPLVITADLPIGTPFLSYPVQMDGLNADGSSTGVIIQDFGP